MPISQVAQVALQRVPLGKPLVVLAWGRHLERPLQIQGLSTLWGLQCAPGVAVPGRRTGEAFLRVGSCPLSCSSLAGKWRRPAEPHQRVRSVV